MIPEATGRSHRKVTLRSALRSLAPFSRAGFGPRNRAAAKPCGFAASTRSESHGIDADFRARRSGSGPGTPRKTPRPGGPATAGSRGGPCHQGPGPGADAPPPPSLRAEPVCQPLSSRRGEGLGRASDSESDSEIRDPGRPGAFDRRSSDEPSSTVKHGSVRPADRRPLATFGRRRSRGPRDPGRTGAGAGALASETPSLAPGPPPSLRRPRGAGNGSCVMKDLQINLEWQHQTADSTLGDPGARATPRLGSLARVGFSS